MAQAKKPASQAAAKKAAEEKAAEAEATPAAAAKAEELGVDVDEVEGSGKGGKVVVADVEAAAELEPDESGVYPERGEDSEPEEDPGEDQLVPGIAKPSDFGRDLDPWAVPKKGKRFNYLDVDANSDPEDRRKIAEILNSFDDALDVNPYPLEWLVASLQAGMALDPEEYRQE